MKNFDSLRAGDECGLMFFFDRYYSSLLLFTQSITHHHEAAQEIVSDSFHKLWLNRHSLLGVDGVKAYLYRVASNAAIDHYWTDRR